MYWSCLRDWRELLSKEESDFSSPDYIAAYYMEDMRHLSVEKVMLLLLDGRHRLMKEILLSKGTANSSWVQSEVFLWKPFGVRQYI